MMSTFFKRIVIKSDLIEGTRIYSSKADNGLSPHPPVTTTGVVSHHFGPKEGKSYLANAVGV